MNVVLTPGELRLFADETTMQDILAFERKEAATGNSGAFEGHIMHLNICE